jgi:uncharacterized protein (TIGR03067 family)
MRWLLTLTTVGLLAAAGGAGGGDKEKKDPAKRDLDGFQGEWKTTALSYDGKDVLADGLPMLRFTFKGNEATIDGSEEVTKDYAKFKIKVDPSTMPKSIDMTVSAGEQLKVVFEGIYELKKDEIRICAKVIGKERPTEFAAPTGSNIAMLVLKRVTP